jgi:hypothetical protein
VKSYIVTTGTAFGLLALAHVARVFAEGAHLMGEPVFLVATAGSAAISVWAVVLLRRIARL